MEPLDLAIVITYLGFVALLGLYFSRRQKTTQDYFLAGRNIPGWVVGYPARAYGAGTFLLSRVTDVSVTYYFLALATAFLTGRDVAAVIFLLGVVTVLYTLIGGIQAVVWSDVIQGTLLIGGGILCIGIVLFQSPVGPAEVFSRAWEGGKFEIGRWNFSLRENNQWFYLLGGMFVWVQSFACGQNNV